MSDISTTGRWPVAAPAGRGSVGRGFGVKKPFTNGASLEPGVFPFTKGGIFEPGVFGRYEWGGLRTGDFGAKCHLRKRRFHNGTGRVRWGVSCGWWHGRWAVGREASGMARSVRSVPQSVTQSVARSVQGINNGPV